MDREREDDSQVYVIFDPLNNRTGQLICGPYNEAVISQVEGNLSLQAWIEAEIDPREVKPIDLAIWVDDHWLVSKDINKRSPAYRAVWFRSAMRHGHPARED